MTDERAEVKRSGAFLLALAFVLTACRGGSPQENLGEAQSAAFTNGGFELGAPGNPPQSWAVQTFINPNPTGVTIQTPQTLAGLNLAAGGNALTTTIAATNQTDPDLGAAASLRVCRYGAKCARVNFHSSTPYGNGQNVNSLSQTMTIGAADVDPTDGQVHVRFVVAPVLQNPAHAVNEQPYYFVQVTNVTQSTILYTDFNLSAQPGVPWKTVNGGTAQEIDYVDWSLVDVAPGAAKLAMGDQVQLEIIASGCALGGHFGEIYVDGAGSTVPGLFVTGTGPAQANAGSNITYDLSYKNGSAAAESNVVIDFTTPPNTTFQGLTPPAGATCVTPAVGATGTIVCTFTNPVPAGAAGSFTLTVQINAGTTGTVVAGTYDIHSAQETPLLGNKIVTLCGCALDADCLAGNWCNETAKSCVPTLANGVAVPTDAPHVNPTLNAKCTVAAGTLVCTSKVCDVADNDCGYKNGDGACTVANQGVVCRSGACDPDGKCGYAVGDGPCSAANGSVVCRSGQCSLSLVCEPAGGCDVDADCPAADWCDESVHTCAPKLANGTAIPTDGPHKNPSLNGTCTPAAGALVCVSGVCDLADNKCGYANEDGPCTPANGGTVCRSGKCSQNLLCEPPNGCNVDADCSGGTWCFEATHTCTAKLANGALLPNDPTHTPTLNATCTAAAAALVCVSGVCDGDNRCGLLNSDGPCSAANGGVVCRSGVCDPDLRCGYASGDGPCSAADGAVVCRSTACSIDLLCEPLGGCNIDADCAGGNWCDESVHTCMAPLPNGQPVPTDGPHTSPTLNGMCTPAAGALTCMSKVCDVKDSLCGYANGDGPCTGANAAVVCRSGACSANLLCEPAGGCNVDADCAGGTWCNETAHLCTPQLANGTAMPTDAPHMSPTLDGTCSAPAATLVCQSGVCDLGDNACGYANGDGPCSPANGGTVCRSATCSVNLLCMPAGGCNVDGDCAAGNWCDETAHACTPQLANGAAMPTDAPHVGPALDGTCTAAAGTLVCQSGVCDVADNECGYANGDGPCTKADGDVVCRSATCSNNGKCEPAGGCNVDTDCAAGTWCNESMSACVPTLPNGMVVPTDPPHTGPTLNGMCTPAAGTLTCTSAVCDANDNECGYANGDGPCTGADGAVVCRSQKCATTGPAKGTCVACVTSADCKGATPVCDAGAGVCVQCTQSSQCSGGTPICDATVHACVPCNGDHGSMATEACPAAEPFCFLAGAMVGQCGKCTVNADCSGHTGNVCDHKSGLCVSGCLKDSDCSAGDWCDADAPTIGACVPKLANGTPLPSKPASVKVCSAAVGTRVCVSGVCDAKDNACGYAAGDGPCANPNQCRNDVCDATRMVCSPPGCTTDADCPAGNWCQADRTCAPQRPDGDPCTAADQCATGSCLDSVCGGPLIGSGTGLLCAAQPERDSGSGGVTAFGLMLAAAGLARRRRR